MASTAVTTRYPKRKRAEISYYDGSSDGVQVDGEYAALDESLEATTRKNLKTSRTTLSKRPLPKRKIFPFALLPAELKNEIYALTLTDPDGIFLIPKTKHYRRTVQRSIPSPTNYFGVCYLQMGTSSSTPISALSPSILLLNRAIYAETQPILYAGNTFFFQNTAAMYAFLAIIGPKNRATLTDVTLRGWGFTKTHKALNHPAFTMLAGAVNLTRLHIDCRIAGGGPRKSAKQLYRDGFHWFEAMGAAKGKLDAAVEVIEIATEYMGTFGHRPFPWEGLRSEETVEEFRDELRKLLQ